MDCLAAGSLFRAIPDEGQECKGPGDAVAVGSRRRGHARVAPFPGEDSGTRFSDIAWSRQSLVPFCPSRAGGLGRAGGDASYLVGQCLIDVAAAKRISPAEALDPAGRRAKSSPASCQDKQKQKIISAKTLISTTPAADPSSSMFTAFFRHCLLPHRIESDISRNCHSCPRCGTRLPPMLALPCLAAAGLRAR